MVKHRIAKQEIGDDGQLHFYDENNDEVFAKVYPWRRRLLAAWIIIFSCATLWLMDVQRRNTQANKTRISDIQASRIESCKRTYESFNEVFAPFFPPPKLQTPKQKHDLKLLGDTIRARKSNCKEQVLSSH